MSGLTDQNTVTGIGRFIFADHVIDMESVGIRTQVNIINTSNGNIILQELF